MSEEKKKAMDLDGDGKVTFDEAMQYTKAKAGELAGKAKVKAAEIGEEAKVKFAELKEDAAGVADKAKPRRSRSAARSRTSTPRLRRSSRRRRKRRLPSCKRPDPAGPGLLHQNRNPMPAVKQLL